jgi:hypothetical protein
MMMTTVPLLVGVVPTLGLRTLGAAVGEGTTVAVGETNGEGTITLGVLLLSSLLQFQGLLKLQGLVKLQGPPPSLPSLKLVQPLLPRTRSKRLADLLPRRLVKILHGRHLPIGGQGPPHLGQPPPHLVPRLSRLPRLSTENLFHSRQLVEGRDMAKTM